jgi:NAD(P)-dependent dehydrogenase (short-subunit alcohol dehydrogenase family)
VNGVFVVTGAASGIGRATAERLAAAGARVVATDLDAADDELTRAVAAFLRHDVTDEAGWDGVIARARELGGLDGLVNNAGISVVRALGDTSLAEWRRVLDVNATGTFLGTRAAVTELRALLKHGSIVNVSSASGIVGGPLSSAYCAAKGAVRLFTKAVALEVAADGIRVNSVHPGAVRTPIWERAGVFDAEAAAREETWRELGAATPLGRVAEPDEVAAAIVYLLSDDARFVTGSELVIDGGYTAG